MSNSPEEVLAARHADEQVTIAKHIDALRDAFNKDAIPPADAIFGLLEQALVDLNRLAQAAEWNLLGRRG